MGKDKDTAKLDQWEQSVLILSNVLRELSIRDFSGHHFPHDEGLERWKEMALEIKKTERTIFFIGNGASASMASHIAADIAKNGGVRAQVFTDISMVTAVSNDLSFQDVYAEPLRWYMKEGDMLVAISSSGNSPNIVHAVKEAKGLGGTVITLSAMSEDNVIRKLGDLNFYVIAKTYGMAETAHAAILHYWMNLVEAERKR